MFSVTLHLSIQVGSVRRSVILKLTHWDDDCSLLLFFVCFRGTYIGICSSKDIMNGKVGAHTELLAMREFNKPYLQSFSRPKQNS
jgi:hypothetical protein